MDLDWPRIVVDVPWRDCRGRSGEGRAPWRTNGGAVVVVVVVVVVEWFGERMTPC